MGERLLEAVVADAKKWAEESGLRPPLTASASIKDFGFKVQVDEDLGKRTATCTYLRNGARSMYELDKKGI